MRHSFGICVILVVLTSAGCSLLTVESPRFTLSSDEGKHVYADKTALSQDALYAAVAEWAADTFHAGNTITEKQDKTEGVLMINGRAEIDYFGGRKQCRYLLTLRAADQQLRCEFETRDLENGYAPNPSHLRQLETRYQALRASLLAKIKQAETAAASAPPQS